MCKPGKELRVALMDRNEVLMLIHLLQNIVIFLPVTLVN